MIHPFFVRWTKKKNQFRLMEDNIAILSDQPIVIIGNICFRLRCDSD